MKKVILAVISLFSAVALRAETPALLAEAVKRASAAAPGWAYTETRTRTTKEGAPAPTIVEIDPSKPYREQFTPIKINGKEPDAKQREQYALRGERMAERRAKAAEQREKDGGGNERPKPRLNFGGGRVVVDLDHATVLTETDESVTYSIPLTPEGKLSVPVEKLRLTATVTKRDVNLTEAKLEVTEPFRQKLIAKVKAAMLTITFTTPDPTQPAVITRQRTDFAVSVFFRNRTGSSEVVSSNFRRVKPYDDRFKATAGAATIFDF